MPRDDRFDLDIHGQRVLFGAGRLNDVAAEVDALGLLGVLLIATGSAHEAADRLCAQLGPRLRDRIAGVVQHVPEEAATAAADTAARLAVEGVITLGGGSATGLGKAVAVRTGLPLLAIPTTYAGSEATSVYGITGTHKTTGRDPRALPRVVVYDPELTTAMPSQLTAASGMNAVAHCVEALYGPTGSPIASLLAQEGIRRLVVSLPTAVTEPQNLHARADALLGAYLAGWAMEQAGTALHHTLCHVIGGTYRVDHGQLHAVLLPYVAAYNATAAADALGLAARALEASNSLDAATDAASGLRALARLLGAPTSLAALGVPADALDDVAARAITAVGDRNPRRPDVPSLRRLLDDALTGQPPGHY